MRFFPISSYKFRLINDGNDTIDRLKRRTEISRSLGSFGTDKSFIGTIEANRFRLITSEIGKGAICILDGKIENKEGFVTIEINKPFKIMMGILMIMPLIGLIAEILKPQEFSYILILVCIGQVLIIRFFMIGLVYKFLSKRSLSRLSDVLDVESMTKIS